MKTLHITEKPIEIYGLDVVDKENGRYWRLPDEESMLVSDSIRNRSKTPCGGRVRFRTNSKALRVRIFLSRNDPDICIPMCGSSGADVLRGTGTSSAYVGVVNPRSYQNLTPEETFRLSGAMEQITINLPRNQPITGMEIEIDDDSEILAPLPYSRPGKLCFYGSSITEGGCALRVANAYTAAVSRWLDIDYVNYGFSGAAKGEFAMADIITSRDFRALIYDYDHNAPSPEFLKDTHQPFFRRIREKKPDLPIVILSKPDFDANPDDSRHRRDVIMKTYTDARAAGDQNVYFLDGERFFGVLGREMCTVDTCHPTDLGFFRMAEIVYGTLLPILK